MLTVGAVEILVADSHGDGGNNRIARFTSDGTYVGEWGETGTARGQFLDPHDLAVDSGGWLFVADRGNYRIRIFDQEGNLLDVWTQCGKPDGLFIDANDVLYVTGANSRPGANTGWEQGIRIGDGRTGWIEAFILSPLPADGAGGWEGVTADNHRNICPAGPGRRWWSVAPSMSRSSSTTSGPGPRHGEDGEGGSPPGSSRKSR